MSVILQDISSYPLYHIYKVPLDKIFDRYAGEVFEKRIPKLLKYNSAMKQALL